MAEQTIKPLRWIGSSHKDIRAFPKAVREDVGYALWEAQQGGKAPNAKPLKGFQGADVVEIAEDYDGDTYRAVYTVRMREAIYVLHVFQKKSKTGIKTPQAELERIRQRLRTAEEDAARLRQMENRDG
jgi:phage-related protein